MKKLNSFINKHKFELISFCIIFILVFAVFGHTSKFGLTNFDDVTIATYKISDFDAPLLKIKQIFAEPVYETVNSMYYRPVLTLSFYLDALISGGDTGFNHYTNTLLHVSAVFLLLLFLLKLGYSKIPSLLLTLLFAVHPALVSAAVWIPGRNDTLFAIFTLLSLIFFVQSINSSKTSYCFFTALSFLAAFFVKETAAIIPVIFILYLFLYNKQPGALTVKTVKTTAIFIAAAFVFYLVVRTAVLSQGAGEFKISSILSNLYYGFFKASAWYFGIVFLTEKIYLFPEINISFYDILKGLMPAFILCVFAYIFRKKINFKHTAFGLLWYFLFLLPTLIIRGGIYLNHRLYIPIIGIIIILLELVIIPALPKLNKHKTAVFSLCALLLLSFSVISYKSSFYYRDRASFWINSYEQNPLSETTNISLARYYTREGDIGKAEYHITKALETDKQKRHHNHTAILVEAANVLMAKNEADKAHEYLMQAKNDDSLNEHVYTSLYDYYNAKNEKENADAVIAEGLALIPKSKLLRNKIKTGNNTNDYRIIMEVK